MSVASKLLYLRDDEPDSVLVRLSSDAFPGDDDAVTLGELRAALATPAACASCGKPMSRDCPQCLKDRSS